MSIGTLFAFLRVIFFVGAGAYAVGSAVLNRGKPVEGMARHMERKTARLVIFLLGLGPLIYGLIATLGMIRIMTR